MAISDFAIKAALMCPTITKLVFQSAGDSMPEHWVVKKIRMDMGIRVTVSTTLGNGMKIKVFRYDPIGDGIRKSGYYEPDTVEIIKSIIKPGKTFIDIGANIGQYTLIAAGIGVPVQSFEPDPGIFEVLKANIAANNLSNVACHRIALSSKKGTAEFHESNAENFGAGSLRHQSQSSGKTFSVQTDTLDSFAAHLDVGAIKIDVEGAELPVLSAAQMVLSKHPPLVIEFDDKHQRSFGSSNEELVHFLHASGYTLKRITKDGAIPYEPRCPEDSFFNVLAV